MRARSIEWVVFDLGETLVDETSNWGRWADYLGCAAAAHGQYEDSWRMAHVRGRRGSW